MGRGLMVSICACRSVPGKPCLEAPFLQFGNDGVTVITLDFDPAITECASHAAFSLELAGQLFQGGVIKQEANCGGDCLAASSGDLTSDPDDAIARRGGLVAMTLLDWLTAAGTQAPMLSGVYRTGMAHFSM